MINDLVTDQRVHRTCLTLTELGYSVTLIGRKLAHSPALDPRPYSTRRMRMLFTSGPLFYLFFNMRLFFILLLSKTNLIFANDLDTLAACRLASTWKNIPLIYDSHEIFCEVPELVNRKFKQSVWRWLEKRIFPKLKHIITVNASIADHFTRLYGVKIEVVRNIPAFVRPDRIKSRQELGLPIDKFIIIVQGSGINIHRGTEELLLAIRSVPDAVLLIVGSGDVLSELKRMSVEHGLKEKVIFIPRKPFMEMIHYTLNADLGATLDKDTNINYRFSLPNKLFDYLHCGIPVLASDLVEVAGIINQYKVGVIIRDQTPDTIAGAIQDLIRDKERYSGLKKNTIHAAAELNWKKESETLRKVISSCG